MIEIYLDEISPPPVEDGKHSPGRTLEKVARHPPPFSVQMHEDFRVTYQTTHILVWLNPPPFPGGYSQRQPQTVAQREGKCRAPGNNQFYIHDNSPGDRVYRQTAEHSKSRTAM